MKTTSVLGIISDSSIIKTKSYVGSFRVLAVIFVILGVPHFWQPHYPIENVYCRSDVPENKSIKIDNDGKIKVYDDGKWKRDTIKEISIQGFRILSGHWRENRHIIDDNTRIWMEDVSSGDKYVLDKMTRDTNSILIKHKDYFQMAE